MRVATLPLLIIVILAGAVLLAWRFFRHRRLPEFEIDSAELGFGDHKISFKPNTLDRQIAYSIWVELSTRKIGLNIDPEDDVVAEVYDSWYAFFGITRELIKDIPVSKLRNDSTRKITNLSIEVLNEGLRPHLTKWQARFRHWYDRQMEKKDDVSPQEVQKKFADFEPMISELLQVNAKLIVYRRKMLELVTGDKEPPQ
ncbi:MAG TPA: hypothetical protein VJ846_11680 [Sphingomicrobium sp.]|nr:hypothetical protein [Sphingomicrobium sp.]